jgi:uncharacterized protein (TIGR03435 family)
MGAFGSGASRLAAIAVWLFFCVAEAWSQPWPAFEVASIKPNRSGARRSGVNTRPDTLVGNNASVKQLLLFAYELPGYRVSGPGWIDAERFDVVAKADGPAGQDRMRLMLQALLADRFRLKFHRESKVMPVYWVVQGKDGFKPPDAKDTETLLKEGPRGAKPGFHGMFLMQHSDLPALAEGLSRVVGRPVLDKTGVDGKFVFYLEWTADPGMPGADARSNPLPDAPPSIFAVLQEKFGLKLESGRATIEVLVIDQVERPTEN